MEFLGELLSTDVRLTVEAATSLLESDPAATFERLWSRLSAFDGSNATAFLDEDGGLFVKGQRIREGFLALLALRSRRLFREARNLREMRAAGLPVPEVVLAGAERRLGIPRRAVLVIRRVRGARSLRNVLRTWTPDERRGVWEPLGRVVAAMHGQRIFHRDLTARNVLIRRDGTDVEVHLIDCPRAERGRSPLRCAHLRRADLLRLVRSVLAEGGTDAEVGRFLDVVGFAGADGLVAVARTSLASGGGRNLRTRLWTSLGI